MKKYAISTIFLIALITVTSNCVFADNSQFYGDFNVTEIYHDFDVTENSMFTFGGSTLSDNCDSNYVYVPQDSSAISYSDIDLGCGGDPTDYDVIISGNTMQLEYTHYCGDVTGVCWSGQIVFEFSSDFNSATFSGTEYDPDPSYKQGRLTGTLTRVGVNPSTPTTNSPNIPNLSSPANGESGTSLTPTLTTAAFSDSDSGDTHFTVSNASSYTLYYAPAPYEGEDTIESINMDGSTSISVELPSGAAFYVAITSWGGGTESGYSNIGYFEIR